MKISIFFIIFTCELIAIATYMLIENMIKRTKKEAKIIEKIVKLASQDGIGDN